MKRVKWSVLFGIVWCWFAGFTVLEAEASPLRCGGRLVDVGDYQYEVTAKCGPPTASRTWVEDRHAYFSHYYDRYNKQYHASLGRQGPNYYERWVYVLGAQRFTRYLLFENGVLIKIELGDKGSRGEVDSGPES